MGQPAAVTPALPCVGCQIKVQINLDCGDILVVAGVGVYM